MYIYLSGTTDLRSVYFPTYFLGMVGYHADSATVHGCHTHRISAPLEDVRNGEVCCDIVYCGDALQLTPGSLTVEDSIPVHWHHHLRINL